MVKVKIKKLDKNATIPQRASEFAGGWDVTATKIKQVDDDLVVCYLGFALEIPENYKLTLVPRSSLTKTRWVMQNSPGLGDADYRGEYQYRFRCLPYGINLCNDFIYEKFPFNIGDRIGQVYLEEVIPIEFEEVDGLSDSIRGNGGFGSTNIK